MAARDYKYNSTEITAMTAIDGVIAVAEDVNIVHETTLLKLNLITEDMAGAYLSNSWAISDQGTEPDGTNYPEYYSSYAYALEAQDWAVSDDPIRLADGNTSSELSAKAHAALAGGSADTAMSSAHFEGTWSAGIYTAPSSVYYDDVYWNLLVASSTEEPGTGSDWAELDTYKVKDNSVDTSPGYLEDKIGPYIATKNLLINPNCVVNQEDYTDDDDLTSGDYCYDMWKSTNSTAINGVTSDGETVTQEANSSLLQINDDLIAENGNSVTASIATGTVTVNGTAVTPSTPYTFTLASSSTTGITITAGAFTGLKVELGSNATRYERPQVTEEELKCARYDDFFEDLIVAAYSIVEKRVIISIPLRVAISSSTPTVTVTGPMYSYWNSTGYSAGTVTLYSQSLHNFSVLELEVGDLRDGGGGGPDIYNSFTAFDVSVRIKSRY